jgi:branched-chain amino acid transport system substrate-binding protein
MAPWTETVTPAQQRYHQVFERLAPGVALNGSTTVGWVSAELLAKAITNLGAEAAGDITVATVLKGLGTIRKDTLGGLTLPLTFKAGQAETGAMTCAFGVLLTDQGWTAPQGNKPRCF